MAGRKLKVFQAQFGFYDTVVAAPSQVAALRAWGVHQNLFASGEATVTTDESAVAAATASPGTPLRRAVGSTDAFSLTPTSMPKAPEAPRARTVAKPAAKPRPAPPAKPPADRSNLDAAEQALRMVDVRRKKEEAELRRAEVELAARKAAAQGAYVEARKAATAKVVKARTAFRKAGGKA